jgi:hypothetical protein
MIAEDGLGEGTQRARRARRTSYLRFVVVSLDDLVNLTLVRSGLFIIQIMNFHLVGISKIPLAIHVSGPSSHGNLLS